jgi:ketosteroid isomerase-like protein
MTRSAKIETLKALVDAFNAHDIDRVMAFFTEDCVLEMPRGPEPHGRRAEGFAAVRALLQTRFDGIPDVHYGDGEHYIDGDVGISKWLLTGTTVDGRPVRVRGCDFYLFRDGKVQRKDAYWKIVEPDR